MNRFVYTHNCASMQVVHMYHQDLPFKSGQVEGGTHKLGYAMSTRHQNEGINSVTYRNTYMSVYAHQVEKEVMRLNGFLRFTPPWNM